MTAAGDLQHRFAFDKRVPGNPDAGAVGEPDYGNGAGPDYGNTEKAFAEQFEVWTARKFLRGSEAVQAARLQGKQPVLLTVRASSQSRQITTDWQARDVRAGTIYAIKAVNPTEDRAYIEILAESGVAS